jgi:hypothetical protein
MDQWSFQGAMDLLDYRGTSMQQQLHAAARPALQPERGVQQTSVGDRLPNHHIIHMIQRGMLQRRLWTP